MKSCRSCGREIRAINIFCNNICQKNLEREEFIVRWLAGSVSGWIGKTRQLSGHVKRYLHETRGTACESCGWNEVHPVDGRILTEIDHIDGNAENCKPSNLRILCPNCHSMTPTFRARNKYSRRNR